ncbi:MAG TPA: integration host factor subunit alpha [Anaerolineae bacterium]|jgi:integration host factor subunit alpha|nr:integration host factor subunit alpha [Anaerolineae bacterium]
MALTKAEMVAQLIDQFSMNKHDSKKLVDQFFEEIRATLEKGEAVKLAGFGNFELRDKNSRPGRNPKTGEDIPITARRVVTFKASPKLKDLVESLPVVTELS